MLTKRFLNERIQKAWIGGSRGKECGERRETESKRGQGGRQLLGRCPDLTLLSGESVLTVRHTVWARRHGKPNTAVKTVCICHYSMKKGCECTTGETGERGHWALQEKEHSCIGSTGGSLRWAAFGFGLHSVVAFSTLFVCALSNSPHLSHPQLPEQHRDVISINLLLVSKAQILLSRTEQGNKCCFLNP